MMMMSLQPNPNYSTNHPNVMPPSVPIVQPAPTAVPILQTPNVSIQTTPSSSLQNGGRTVTMSVQVPPVPKVTEEQTKGISRKLEGSTKKVEPNGHFNALGWAAGVTALAGGAYLIATKGKGHLALSKTVVKEVSAEVPAVTKAIEVPAVTKHPIDPPVMLLTHPSPSLSSSVEPVRPAEISMPETSSSKVTHGSQTQPTTPHSQGSSTSHSASSVSKANLSFTEQIVVAGFAKDAKGFIERNNGVGMSETTNSMGDRRIQSHLQPVLKKVTGRSNYYSVQLNGEQYLVPRDDFGPNTYSLQSCQALFEIPVDALDNLQTKGFRLVKPAKIDPDGTLKEKGILEFIVL